MNSSLNRIAVAYGDGIGPEIMEATLHILKNALANLTLETIEIGEKVYKKGWASGITKEAWDKVKDCKVLLKAPITTPQGGGYKSLNVTFRKSLGLFANVRPVASYSPYAVASGQNIDMFIIRENEEDLYAGIEYTSTSNSSVALKVITKSGSARIIRYAFEYAKANNRKKVTCLSKDNIMKLTDGLFHKTFDEIAKEYPEIETNHWIIDIGAAKIATAPEEFEVVVTENLYGDIISDIAAEVSGSVGLAGSANVGSKYAMFEAVHGSAPDIAGKDIANPSGLINAAIMMLEHFKESDTAALIKNAWLKTIEDGIHTSDIYREGVSHQKVGTFGFAEAVVKNLGSKPSKLKAVKGDILPHVEYHTALPQENSYVEGIDIYISQYEGNVAQLAERLQECNRSLKLHSISQRGAVIWPHTEIEFYDRDLLRLRFTTDEQESIKQSDLISLQYSIVDELRLNIASTNTLLSYGKERKLGFSLAQGE